MWRSVALVSLLAIIGCSSPPPIYSGSWNPMCNEERNLVEVIRAKSPSAKSKDAAVTSLRRIEMVRVTYTRSGHTAESGREETARNVGLPIFRDHSIFAMAWPNGGVRHCAAYNDSAFDSMEFEYDPEKLLSFLQAQEKDGFYATEAIVIHRPEPPVLTKSVELERQFVDRFLRETGRSPQMASDKHLVTVTSKKSAAAFKTCEEINMEQPGAFLSITKFHGYDAILFRRQGYMLFLPEEPLPPVSDIQKLRRAAEECVEPLIAYERELGAEPLRGQFEAFPPGRLELTNPDKF